MEYKYYSETARYFDAIIEAVKSGDFERAASLEQGCKKYAFHPENWKVKDLSSKEGDMARNELEEICNKKDKALEDHWDDMEHGRYLLKERERKWKENDEKRWNLGNEKRL